MKFLFWRISSSGAVVRSIGALIVAPFLLLAASGAAQADGKITIELNRMAAGEKGCLVSFVMQNGLGAPIDELALEVVLFDSEGRVDRILLLSSGALPKDKTRVKQFELEGTTCSGISQILLNDVSSCKGDGLDPGACLANLEIKSREGVKFTL